MISEEQKTNEEIMTTYFVAVADFIQAHPELTTMLSKRSIRLGEKTVLTKNLPLSQ